MAGSICVTEDSFKLLGLLSLRMLGKLVKWLLDWIMDDCVCQWAWPDELVWRCTVP